MEPLNQAIVVRIWVFNVSNNPKEHVFDRCREVRLERTASTLGLRQSSD